MKNTFKPNALKIPDMTTLNILANNTGTSTINNIYIYYVPASLVWRADLYQTIAGLPQPKVSHDEALLSNMFIYVSSYIDI